MADPLQTGAPAPAFRMPRDGGDAVTLADYAGKALVLYFYPKDDTSGCTREAADFNALMSAFRDAGAEILGVSPDSDKSHAAFRQKHGLAISLGSDESKEVCQAYGVWQEKSMYGRKYMGVERTTFLIGPDGRIAEIWPKVSVKGHAEAVLAAVKALPR
ncbi:MAG: peroxiredoxin [Janthinobacterium lividum]